MKDFFGTFAYSNLETRCLKQSLSITSKAIFEAFENFNLGQCISLEYFKHNQFQMCWVSHCEKYCNFT